MLKTYNKKPDGRVVCVLGSASRPDAELITDALTALHTSQPIGKIVVPCAGVGEAGVLAVCELWSHARKIPCQLFAPSHPKTGTRGPMERLLTESNPDVILLTAGGNTTALRARIATAHGFVLTDAQILMRSRRESTTGRNDW